MTKSVSPQCPEIRKGYIVENNTIYHDYRCLKLRNHDGFHEFYNEELNLPIFKKFKDAVLYKQHITKKKKTPADYTYYAEGNGPE